MSAELLLTFLGVCLLAYITPGPDWFVIMRFTALRRWTGFISALGVQAGLALHVIVASLGVTAVVLAGPAAFTVLKFAGAGYLIFLGGQSLVRAHRDGRKDTRQQRQEADETETGPLGVLWKSFLANALNPQAAIFFVAVLPQFINPTESLLLQITVLGALDIGLGLLWWVAYIYGIALIRRFLGAQRSQRILNTVAGLALITLGIVLTFLDPANLTSA